MKRVIIIVLILSGIAFAKIPGSNYGAFGLGVMIGQPTGFNFKFWRLNDTAFDAGLAWSFGSESSLNLHVDYLLHDFSYLSSYRGNMPFYYGIGGRLKFQSKKDNRFGIRIPLGAAYHFPKAPLDIFFEIAPIIDFVPETDLDFNIGIGARFYFK
jgi:hypothetical protein